jgi:hypothetical protein
MSGELLLGLIVVVCLVAWVILLVSTVVREYFGWAHVFTSYGEQPFKIEGIDVWSAEWIDKDKTVSVRDPAYGHSFETGVFEINVGRKKPVTFAVDEYSPGVYLFYRRRRDLPILSRSERRTEG